MGMNNCNGVRNPVESDLISLVGPAVNSRDIVAPQRPKEQYQTFAAAGTRIRHSPGFLKLPNNGLIDPREVKMRRRRFDNGFNTRSGSGFIAFGLASLKERRFRR
jgi:hypothetical protein